MVTMAGEERRGLLLGIGFLMWTHGASASIGGFPAGQESHPAAIVELDDGSIKTCELECLRMLDSDAAFAGFSWGDAHER